MSTLEIQKEVDMINNICSDIGYDFIIECIKESDNKGLDFVIISQDCHTWKRNDNSLRVNGVDLMNKIKDYCYRGYNVRNVKNIDNGFVINFPWNKQKMTINIEDVSESLKFYTFKECVNELAKALDNIHKIKSSSPFAAFELKDCYYDEKPVYDLTINPVKYFLDKLGYIVKEISPIQFVVYWYIDGHYVKGIKELNCMYGIKEFVRDCLKDFPEGCKDNTNINYNNEYNNLMLYLDRCRHCGCYGVSLQLKDDYNTSEVYIVSKNVLDRLIGNSIISDYYVRKLPVEDIYNVVFCYNGELTKRNYLYYFFVNKFYDSSYYSELIDYDSNDKEFKVKQLKDEDIIELINNGYNIKKEDDKYIISWN